jgi:hypothetical protein
MKPAAAQVHSMDEDAIYFSERERTERCLAENAKTEPAKAAHMTLANAYRQRAKAAKSETKREKARPTLTVKV